MEKLLIFSDLHGVVSGAQILQEAVRLHRPDRILFLGDALYHGPRNDIPADYAPKLVIPVLNGFKDCITAVRGNCDAEVDQMVLDYPLMDTYRIIESDGLRICMTHGHVFHPGSLPDENFDLFLSGHTHVPGISRHYSFTAVNPGSVSMPKEDHPRTYAVLGGKDLIIYTGTHELYMSAELKRSR